MTSLAAILRLPLEAGVVFAEETGAFCVSEYRVGTSLLLLESAECVLSLLGFFAVVDVDLGLLVFLCGSAFFAP